MLRKCKFFNLLLTFFISFALLAGCGGGGGGGGVVGPLTVVISLVSSTGNPLGDMRCVDEGNMIACRGIPYAEPPVDELRFAVPVINQMWNSGWDGTFRATEFGNKCVQDDGSGSEDCLFLNVFFPKGTEPGDALPVMFWIHGGALIQGEGSLPGYDVPDLVKKGVVVVTINYRLNAFGFLPHPALEDPTGNFGLKDQVLALQWVQDFIENFGGDPTNVTIFGESAGGHSVLSLLVADPVIVGGLFHKAIVQSGSYSPTQTDLATVGYFGLGLPFANVLGTPSTGPCGGTDDTAEIRACLRDLTVEEVMDAQNSGPAWAWISPVYAAGTFLPQSISTAITAGNIADVPIMIGSNLNEGSLFTALFMGDYNNFDTLADLELGVITLLATDPRVYSRVKVASDYTSWAEATYGANDNKYRNAHSMIFTDATFTCNCLGQWVQLAALPRTVYAYWFTDSDAPINPTYSILEFLADLFNLGEWGFGACHSFEIQYIFGHLKERLQATDEQKALSNRMINYWTNFAQNGAPGGGWTAFNGTNIRVLNPAGDSDATAVAFAGAHYCAYWADPGTFWP